MLTKVIWQSVYRTKIVAKSWEKFDSTLVKISDPDNEEGFAPELPLKWRRYITE